MAVGRTPFSRRRITTARALLVRVHRLQDPGVCQGHAEHNNRRDDGPTVLHVLSSAHNLGRALAEYNIPKRWFRCKMMIEVERVRLVSYPAPYKPREREGSAMRRATVNFIVDLIGFVNLLLLATTGAIMKWVLPPGSGGGGGRGYGFRGGRGPGAGEARQWLGLGRHDWGYVHFVLALLFLSMILVHLVLHWTWIKTCAKSILLPSRKARCDPADERDVP
jgi:hypothetical protein